ncbi:hypothetical protein KVR01_003500 [Diaporthe batatas]|uniref:uncharacterized protein n=1 Tax=Diaporthe batatas TaxID=748121 RepID=UPI001D03F60E|nr:uncharacterized protein KVR01_003500 [Diaporthe batatas]KAG8167811.1 hypothetical protein KVR01_003500 [Diaporthe batatas]
MDASKLSLPRGPFGSNADKPPSPVLITETYHSTIQLGNFNGRVAIIKTFRNQNHSRTTLRFHNEVDALRLAGSHANITQLLDADIGRIALTLRVEPGQSLDKYVDDRWKSTISSGDSITLWKQMSSALAHLHTNSITHDDVKPDNIMWDPSAQHAVLIDFGAALNHNILPADWFNPSGTPPYAPPEFLHRGKGNAGDVWALGVTMLFAFKYISLPDGNWILPHIFEDQMVLEEMKSWLTEVEGWRRILLGRHDDLLAEMLDPDPDNRIVAAELELQLKTQEIQDSDYTAD